MTQNLSAIELQQDHLAGPVIKIVTNGHRSRIELHLGEASIKQEEPSTSTGNETRKTLHRIKFLGDWCPMILPDLKQAARIKLDLSVYEPEFDLKLDRWEFRNGIRAELVLKNTEQSHPPFFLKKIDIGQTHCTACTPRINCSHTTLGQLPFCDLLIYFMHRQYPLMTLDEIDKMPGGTSRPFSVIAIIDEKKTEQCERAARGTMDYRMTVYLTDSSRGVGVRNVTCNLFWKTAESCPPWGKALWKVIILFNVYKRASALYDTQIIGPSNIFQWALWAPGYIGSVEQLHSSNQNLAQFASLFDLTPDVLKAKALALYQQHNAQSDPDLFSQHAAALVPSVPKSISDLTIGFRQKFDLCVEVLDLWVEESGNDRMSVTDYTSNPMLRTTNQDVSKMIELTEAGLEMNPVAAVTLHRSQGGTAANWRVTESRVMTVYIAPPILRAIYGQFKPQTGTSADTEESEGWGASPNVYDYRGRLVNKVVRLSQLDLCVRAGFHQKGIVYALMANPYKSRLELPDDESSCDPDEHQLARFANRISPVSPSEPAYRKLMLDKALYTNELNPSSPP
ncbi:hypothetical protein VP01_456g6 [Puccinia sorghi]|uniref:Uncharacterized protein n=1 Tax=Puccinia sorghi TaxID=27349 RepID=A0A0L6UQP1_9BASI|nr:hypothetical protein VP01_456g6 [Puccinia sorghi]